MPKARQSRRTKAEKRTYDARPDSPDFRDRMFTPTLTEVPPKIELDAYRRYNVPVLDQGAEGACTGFGLATVANFLLVTRDRLPDTEDVSPRMLYEMARRYDEWPGTDYSGSSARGAMKGWHKHGVCSEAEWPYTLRSRGDLTNQRAQDATNRPLGAYFRVNHKNLVAMHVALAEVRVLYATAVVHEGWNHLDADGVIPWNDHELRGGHAFAIVAYDRTGFWIQNSWGESWGQGGFAKITYGDWLANGKDVWVARLGVPVDLDTASGVASAVAGAGAKSRSYSFNKLRPHIVSVGNDGKFREDGFYSGSMQAVRSSLHEELPELAKSWKRKRLMLYAHGGLTSEDSAVQRVAEYREPFLGAEVFPLAFVWRTDYWTTLGNMLRDAFSRRRSEGVLDAAQDFMLDRLDDALEPIARRLTGKAQWDEMKENALRASQLSTGAARKTATAIAELVELHPDVELHVVGHSAGAVFHAPLVQLLATKGKIKLGPMKGKTGLGLPIASCTLWAPACTVELFKASYAPLIKSGGISRFAAYTLTDEAERDDHCANLYHKSLLYLVSNAFEDKPRIPLFREGEPILGMERFIRQDPELLDLLQGPGCDWVLAPNNAPAGSKQASGSLRHGDFDDDQATVQSTIARIVGKTAGPAPVMHQTARGLHARRKAIDTV